MRFRLSGRPPFSAIMLQPKFEFCKLGEAEQLVQHHIGHRIALQFDHDAHAVAVGFVAEVGNAFELLVAHQFRDLLDQAGLVHLIGNFREDDGFAVFLVLLLMVATPRTKNGAARGLVGLADAGAAHDRAAGGEIRAGHDLHQFPGSVISGLSIIAMQASMTSPRSCGGILVAMPTAIPVAPLTSRFGMSGRENGRLV